MDSRKTAYAELANAYRVRDREVGVAAIRSRDDSNPSGPARKARRSVVGQPIQAAAGF
jgi:hypothetical protein